MSTIHEYHDFLDYLSEILVDTFRHGNSPSDIPEIVTRLTAAS